MKHKKNKKNIKPIISTVGRMFINEVELEGSPHFKAHPKDYISLGKSKGKKEGKQV